MKKYFVRILAAIGAWVVTVAIFGLVSSLMSRGYVPEKVILEMDLGRVLLEYVPDDPVAGLMLESANTTRDVVNALQRAAVMPSSCFVRRANLLSLMPSRWAALDRGTEWTI